MVNDPPKHFELITLKGEILRPSARLKDYGLVLRYESENAPVLLNKLCTEGENVLGNKVVLIYEPLCAECKPSSHITLIDRVKIV